MERLIRKRTCRRSSPTSGQMVATSRASTTRSPRIILLLAASPTPIPQMFVRLPDLGTLRLNIEALVVIWSMRVPLSIQRQYG
ncbi:hypothetical protein J2Y48_000366 [Mycoplana sp. BE70]|uniref:hypothetical protein n=1 Tax=Mycoplana sp. BE70 TaxID=2817775 RepID=UPI002861A8CE|nr:hypothetical protein [Mycoplana sp. BE70]MDR6755093.1 hypothetical protein [Mycoplana sp. BE70]